MVFGCKMQEENMYRLKDHLPSIEWIKEMPSSYLSSDKIDLDMYDVEVSKNADSCYVISIGSKEPHNGGGGITIFLTKDLKLDYFTDETYAPTPTIEPIIDEDNELSQ
jgi:hypothetical protein